MKLSRSWVSIEPSSSPQSSKWKTFIKTVAITVSAPLLLPPFLIFSAVGFVSAFPFTVYLAGLALTNKVMSFLFTQREREDYDDIDDDEGEGEISLPREIEGEEVREVGEGEVGKLLTTMERKFGEKEEEKAMGVPVEEPKKEVVEVPVEKPVEVPVEKPKKVVEVPVEDVKVDKKGKGKKKGK